MDISVVEGDVAFDEDWYLATYPGVAAAVSAGGFKSGKDHYLLCGRFEGRIPVPPVARPPSADSADPETPFDEAWYLEKYPEIAEVVKAGGFYSGKEHYIKCGQFEARMPVPSLEAIEEKRLEAVYVRQNGDGFLAPTDLTVTQPKLNRIALIGSCMAEVWTFRHQNPANCPVDLITVNNLSRLPRLAPEVITAYDFSIVQIPLPAIIGNETVWRLAYTDDAGYEHEFDRACERLERYLDNWMEWNRDYGLLTFVANFMLPQQNPMGRLFPRYSLSNPEYFIARLNEHLEKIVLRSRNTYILNLDQLSASVGRRYMQDDSVTLTSHNGLIPFGVSESERIEINLPLGKHYEIKSMDILPNLVWHELMAMYRTVRQTDPVKVVIVDLDDTLWHGVSGDMQEFDGQLVAGWPIGVAEALMYLKKRGVLLAIASKNEEVRIREIWPAIFTNRLHLEDFAAVRINWRPKVDNVREILGGMSLLPRNAIFIDDNPAEREAMQRAFPDMRVLGRYPHYLRRILLWSSETQVAAISEESSRRTEMIQAQFTREARRGEMSREQFLQDAAPNVTIFHINGTGHPRFTRVFELINKTNQFNTTGRRWKIEECEEFFRLHGQMVAFEVTDQFTNYGLVGVVIFLSAHIEQWVMSCRVLGYQIEEAVMATIVIAMRAGQSRNVTGRLIHTDVNFPCRDLFPDCGFTENGDGGGNWLLAADTRVAVPDHISVRQV